MAPLGVVTQPNGSPTASTRRSAAPTVNEAASAAVEPTPPTMSRFVVSAYSA